jgi:formamidopyrimidine-DNA glycosylase
MAELPELTILQRQMHKALTGRRIASVEITQPKCLNVPIKTATTALSGKRIASVTRRGKWLSLNLEPQLHVLLNLGMGADLWHRRRGAPPPAKYQLGIALDDGSGFTCRFWWFGHVHLLTPPQLPKHRHTARLGPSPLEVSPGDLIELARRFPRSTAKGLILDQEKLSGIGNAYAHDVLWKAGIHPQRKLVTLSDADLTRYHAAIRYVMRRAMDKGGLETDFFQQQGNLKSFHKLFLVGYKEKQPCPRCRTLIRKIRTGGTATFLCPACQPHRTTARRTHAAASHKPKSRRRA